MKRACLLIVVPALLVALGFAQTPTASSNPAPTSIKGCLGGSDGNYTLAEDSTGHNFKLAAGSVDLKPFLGQSVALIGLEANTTASSGAAHNGFAVNEAKMVSEHCATAAVAPATSISTTADTAITPTVVAATTAATVPTPPETATAPVADAAAPAGAVPPPQPEVTPPSTAAATAAAGPTPAELASPPPAATPRPATVTPPVQIVEAPPVAAERPSARSRRSSGTLPAAAKTVAAAPLAETATPVADTAIPAAAASTPSPTATEPDPVAPRPVVPAKSGSLLWIPIVVVVLIMGAVAPLLNRWRKRRLLEQTSEQNLSFSHRASSEPGTSNKPTGRKAA